MTPAPSMPLPRRVVLTALFFHAPGLWLLCHATLARELWWPNLLAVAVTVVAVIGVWTMAGPTGAVITWAVGHAAWGTFLALALLHDPTRLVRARAAGSSG